MTKPEGPAQEPQVCTCHWIYDDGAPFEPCPIHVPATPAPALDGICTECGQPNPIWFAPNDIWNRLIPGRVGFLCPRCFALKSPETVWVLQEAEPRVYSTSGAPSKPASLREAVEQLRAIPAAWKERPDPLAELHEIRYGSQPAGAREWADANDVLLHTWGSEQWMQLSDVDAFLAQQTAAKDAALQAAERERDSLREALTQVPHKQVTRWKDGIDIEVCTANCPRCKAENAAPKAGKETKL